MKLVIRADDIGYSNVCNIGSFEAIDNGIVTSADVMLDTPGTVDALERLRNYPWLSVGWHTHFWGTPVLGGDRVPTLYDAERGGFREDLFTAEVSGEEVIAECRAELDLCVRLLGRAPDACALISPKDTPFGRALLQILREYHIVYDFMGRDLMGPEHVMYDASEKWADRKIFIRGIYESIRPLRTKPLTPAGWTDSLAALNEYDPVRFYLEDEAHLLELPEDTITVNAWHPGYVDYYVFRCGDFTPPAGCFKDIRTVDVHALCSTQVKDWVKRNRVELINLRDALYGTNEYQNHLRAVGSELAVDMRCTV